jgi:hypothetical protein
VIVLRMVNKSAVLRYQQLITLHHYLRTPVDSRCSVEAYGAYCRGWAPEVEAGCLIFGRPEATRCSTWYGSVEDVEAGRCEVTRWGVLNVARVWLSPAVQRGGQCCSAEYGLPGFIDRRGEWRSTLASEVLNAAARTIGYEYLLRRPPCFLDEPYEIRWLMSYADSTIHRGTIYREAGWELYRTNKEGIQTWRTPLPPLTPEQDAEVRRRAGDSPRSKRYRAQRAAAAVATQMAMEGL